jgi:hypothetical protein
MSYQRALDAIHGKITDRHPLMAAIDHPVYLQKLTGIDTLREPRAAFLEACRLWDVDFLFGGPPDRVDLFENESQKVIDEQTRATEWGLSGSRWVEHEEFQTHEDVLSFEPKKHDLYTVYHNLPAGTSVAQLVDEFGDRHRSSQDALGAQALVCGGFGTTLFQWFVALFGWNLFLETAALYPARFRDVIARFAEMSRLYTEAWAQTDIVTFTSHDDLAMTRGLVFRPDWYRENILPWYPTIWEPLKAAGKKVIFVSDGSYSALVDDLAVAGADGFYMESLVDLGMMAGKFPDKILIGNTDPRVITFGTPAEVEAEVARCFTQAGHLPGYIFHPSGDLPHNIPIENLDALITAFRQHAPNH